MENLKPEGVESETAGEVRVPVEKAWGVGRVDFDSLKRGSMTVDGETVDYVTHLETALKEAGAPQESLDKVGAFVRQTWGEGSTVFGSDVDDLLMLRMHGLTASRVETDETATNEAKYLLDLLKRRQANYRFQNGPILDDRVNF